MKSNLYELSKSQVLTALRYNGIYIERVSHKSGPKILKASDGFKCESMQELASHFKTMLLETENDYLKSIIAERDQTVTDLKRSLNLARANLKRVTNHLISLEGTK